MILVLIVPMLEDGLDFVSLRSFHFYTDLQLNSSSFSYECQGTINLEAAPGISIWGGSAPQISKCLECFVLLRILLGLYKYEASTLMYRKPSYFYLKNEKIKLNAIKFDSSCVY